MTTMEKIMERPEVKVLLGMMKLSNIETYRHSLSVASLVEKMLNCASQSTFTEYEREQIIEGALLHDIGKIFLPFNLTQLPSSLSDSQYDIIKIHASISYEVVKSTFSDIVQNICLYHHEKPNGNGYMAQIKLKDIPDEALLVQIADVYDAMTSERSYKKSFTPEQSIKIMESDCEKFLLDDRYFILLKKVLIEHKILQNWKEQKK